MPAQTVLFRQDLSHLVGIGLGDNSVRAIALRHIADVHGLDVHVVVGCDEKLMPVWRRILGADRISTSLADVPAKYLSGRAVAATRADWERGWRQAPNIFASVMLESGFRGASDVVIQPPNVFPCDRAARAALICPNEKTGGNEVHDAVYWRRVVALLRKHGYRIHLCGDMNHAPLCDFYATTEFDAVFAPTIESLADAVSRSSLLVAGSTGPSWALMASDIEQIAIEPPWLEYPLWHFHRCRSAIAKPLWIVPRIELMEEQIKQCAEGSR